jgi:outer membrane protein OmpA-like peptidoglycan-associated protein
MLGKFNGALSRISARAMAKHPTRTLLAMAITIACGAVHAQDIEGSVDHALAPRYEGSEIVRYDTQKFTDYRLMVKPATAYGGVAKNLAATLPLEGTITRISYRAPADRSVLEVFRNYENALKAAGFEPVFACERKDCGGRNFNAVMASGFLYSLFGEYQAEQRYLAAKLSRPEGDVYAAVYAVMNKSGGGPNKDRVMLQLDVVELKPMEQRMVLVKAADIERDLASAGRVAIYGILFDLDKDTMRPDSKPQLDEIGALLKRNPGLKVLVVGHTDAQGTLEYNSDLSLRRARSIAKVLISDYGVDAGRLTPIGVGMAAPLATNRTAEGRAKNRRVELVDWSIGNRP